MKKLIASLLVLVALLFVIAFAVVSTAYADDFEACLEDFNLEDCVPEGGTLIIDITQTVVNDIDSGIGGNYWAYDNYDRYIRVWDFDNHVDPLTIVSYNGSFTTVAGPSPNNTGTVGEGVTGTMAGGYIAWFEASSFDPLWPTSGYVGEFDYEGDPETGAAPGYVNWLLQYWDEYWDWSYVWWGWYYNACENGWWINSSENEGDITGDPTGLCPLPPPPPVTLVPRYRMVTLIDADAPDWFYGQDGRNGTCWVKMPTSEGLPSVEEQHRICNYNNGEQVYEDYVADGPPLYDAWVMWNPVTGEVLYPDPLWDSAWFDPDYTTVIGPPIGP